MNNADLGKFSGTVKGLDAAAIDALNRRLLKRRAFREAVSGYLFVAPATIILLAFFFLPTLYAFVVSFYRWDFMNPVKTWVGLGNYIGLLTSGEFWHVMWVTVYYMIGAIPFAMFFALILALCINEKLKFLAFFRTATFAPVVASIVAMSAVWLWMYDPINGLLNYFLKIVGLAPLRWLTDTQLAMPSLILFDIWKHTGYDMIIYLAGIQSIPDSYYEAAKIDGANAWQRFRRVTLPSLSPITFFLIVTNVTYAFFDIFGTIDFLTKGGPAGATEVMIYRIYQLGILRYDLGKAAAQSIVLFLLVIGLTVLQFRTTGQRVTYGA